MALSTISVILGTAPRQHITVERIPPYPMSTWKIDPAHSSLTFKVSHLKIFWVRGYIKNIRGTLRIDPEHLENSSVQAEMDLKDLSTGVEKRDEHLQSADF